MKERDSTEDASSRIPPEESPADLIVSPCGDLASMQHRATSSRDSESIPSRKPGSKFTSPSLQDLLNVDANGLKRLTLKYRKSRMKDAPTRGTVETMEGEPAIVVAGKPPTTVDLQSRPKPPSAFKHPPKTRGSWRDTPPAQYSSGRVERP